MKRTNIYLPEEQLRALRHVSESRGRPVAELVRDAVAAWLKAQGVRVITDDGWATRSDALMERRRKIAEAHDWDEEQIMRDAVEAVREVRRMRSARGR